MRHDNSFKLTALSAIWAWLCIFVLLSFCITLIASLLTPSEKTIFSTPLTLINYTRLFQPIYLKIFSQSLYIAMVCTLFCLIIGYPFAYLMAKSHPKHKDLLIILLVIPFWTSSLIRSYAIIAIIKTKGVLNAILLATGIIHHPLQLLFTNTAVIIGLVYNLLPFMILPLYTNLEKHDPKLIEAARDLGANNFTIFRRITLPLSMPGIISGAILVILPSMTLFYIPDLLGGAKSLLLGNLIEYQFLTAHNWPSGAAISVALTLIMGLLILCYKLTTHATDFKELAR